MVVKSLGRSRSNSVQEGDRHVWKRRCGVEHLLASVCCPPSVVCTKQTVEINAGRTHSHIMKYSLIGSFPDRNDEVTTTLRDLLTENRSKFATDPRDKVFALLGLAEDSTESRFQPDYSKSVQEVYKETTKEVITRELSLAILEYAGLSRLQIELPSWCVDWTYGEGDDDNKPVPIRTLSWLLRTFDLSPSDPNIALYGHDVAASSAVQMVAVFDKSLSLFELQELPLARSPPLVWFLEGQVLRRSE